MEQTVSYCLYDSINTVNNSVGHPLKILINNHYTTKQQASEGTSVWLFSLFLEVFLTISYKYLENVQSSFWDTVHFE